MCFGIISSEKADKISHTVTVSITYTRYNKIRLRPRFARVLHVLSPRFARGFGVSALIIAVLFRIDEKHYKVVGRARGQLPHSNITMVRSASPL